MELAAAISAVIGFIWWLCRIAAKRSTDPEVRALSRREQVAREILENDAKSANRRLDDWLLRVRLIQSNQRRPKLDPPPKQPGIHAGS